MKKIEIAKTWLSKEENLQWILNELDLWLDNNHSSEMTSIYSLITDDKTALENYYRVITKNECLKLKWTIITDVIEIVKNGIAWDCDISISGSTIKKAMKEIDFYNSFNTLFTDRLQGEAENVEIFKRWFIR